MDKNLYKRWKLSMPPFESVLCAKNYEEFNGEQVIFTLPELQEILLLIMEKLQNRYRDSKLISFDDWHEHDGSSEEYPDQSRPSSWERLKSEILSNPHPYEVSLRDDLIYSAYYPENFSFLLRFRHEAEYFSEPYHEKHTVPVYGQFNLSGGKTLIDDIMLSIPNEYSSRLTIGSAKRFFDKTCAG